MSETIVQPKYSTQHIAERLTALEEKVSERNGENRTASKKREKDDQPKPAKEESTDSLLLGNMPLDQEPMVRLMSDLFGENIENLPSRDVQLVAGIIELAQNEVGADLTKVWKFVSKLIHETSGEKKLRSVYRMLSLGLSADDKGGESRDKSDTRGKRND